MRSSKPQTSTKRNGKLNHHDHSKDHMAPSASKTSVMDAKAHQVLSGSDEEISKDSGKGKRRPTIRGKMGQGVSLSERPKESPSSQRNVPKSNRRKCSKKENKGRLFRSSSLVQMTDSGSTEIIDTNTGFVGSEQDKAISVDVVIDERNTSVSGILVDVVRNNENFFHPRPLLSQASYPPVDGALTVFELVTECGNNLTDPTQVFVLPPQSVLSEIEEKLNKSKTTPLFFKFPGYGIFDRDGIRVLGRFQLVKSLKRQVQFEEKWLKQAFNNEEYEQEVTAAMLDRWNKDGSFLASYGNYKVTSQVLSSLVGERYLCDEIIDFLIQKYCDKANAVEMHHGLNILLSSFLSTGAILRNVEERLSLTNDMEKVGQMFLPVHLHNSHWGLAVFSVSEKTISFDDGFHCAIPEELKRNSKEILKIIHKTTGNEMYLPVVWNNFKRFKVPMPDQPTNGSGSCGVAEICTVRDICNGLLHTYSWTYEDAPTLRAELMVEILDLERKWRRHIHQNQPPVKSLQVIASSSSSLQNNNESAYFFVVLLAQNQRLIMRSFIMINQITHSWNMKHSSISTSLRKEN